MQGYNAQAAVTTDQIVVAAEVTTTAPDYGQLEPLVRAALRNLGQAGVTDNPVTVLADAGYWHKEQMERIISDGMQVLISPDSGLREGARPGWEGGFYVFIRRVLATDHGRALYRKAPAHRAGVRTDQSQPTDRPLPTKRPGRRQV